MSAGFEGAQRPATRPESSPPVRDLDRVTELEGRLRRIWDEVRAAGVVFPMEPVDAEELPELDDLTIRQREVLQRLLNGERVPTIANELYISRSTVRNHLAAIFHKFGVHSQTELIVLFQRQKA